VRESGGCKGDDRLSEWMHGWLHQHLFVCAGLACCIHCADFRILPPKQRFFDPSGSGMKAGKLVSHKLVEQTDLLPGKCH